MSNEPLHTVSFREAVRTFAYIGLNSFGGPTGQIAVMHKVLVEQKRWISEERFLHALNFCMLLPGPEAMQLVTYVGWLFHKARGGLVAGLLFILPGFLSILALSIAFSALGHVGPVAGLMFGLKAAVLAIVVEAVVRIAKRILKGWAMVAIASAAFICLFALHIPFPLVIGSAAAIGIVGGRFLPSTFAVLKPNAAEGLAPRIAYLADSINPATAPHTRPSLTRALRVLAVWLPLWLVPVAGLYVWLGPGNVFVEQAIFFSKAAVVTFGGAYAALAYAAQQAVDVYGWLKPGEMITGLGLAETTPGPLIMVLQFVGYMGAFRRPGGLDPTFAGFLASVLAAWTTFVPCFLWIFLGAPFMEALRGNRTLSAALSCITAAVVGVILNLAIWFGTHTLFATVTERSWPLLSNAASHPVRPQASGTAVLGDMTGAIAGSAACAEPGAPLAAVAFSIPVPDFATLDVAALFISLVSAALIFIFKRGVLVTLAVAAAMGIGWTLIGSAPSASP